MERLLETISQPVMPLNLWTGANKFLIYFKNAHKLAIFVEISQRIQLLVRTEYLCETEYAWGVMASMVSVHLLKPKSMWFLKLLFFKCKLMQSDNIISLESFNWANSFGSNARNSSNKDLNYWNVQAIFSHATRECACKNRKVIHLGGDSRRYIVPSFV